MNNDKAMLLVHTVFKGEGWQDTADKIITMINSAGKKSPGRSAVMSRSVAPGRAGPEISAKVVVTVDIGTRDTRKATAVPPSRHSFCAPHCQMMRGEYSPRAHLRGRIDA